MHAFIDVPIASKI